LGVASDRPAGGQSAGIKGNGHHTGNIDRVSTTFQLTPVGLGHGLVHQVVGAIL
jgi:hypothetical protein